MARIRRKVTRTGAKPSRKIKKIILSDEEKAKRKAQDVALATHLKSVTNWIIAPAGKPTHDLEGEDLDSVSTWVAKLKETAPHTVQSCQYWVKYFFDPFEQKDQWKAVRKIISDNHELFGIPNLPPAKYVPTKDDKRKQVGW